MHPICVQCTNEFILQPPEQMLNENKNQLSCPLCKESMRKEHVTMMDKYDTELTDLRNVGTHEQLPNNDKGELSDSR